MYIYTYKSKVAGVAVGGRDLFCERITLTEGRPGDSIYETRDIT